MTCHSLHDTLCNMLLLLCAGWADGTADLKPVLTESAHSRTHIHPSTCFANLNSVLQLLKPKTNQNEVRGLTPVLPEPGRLRVGKQLPFQGQPEVRQKTLS